MKDRQNRATLGLKTGRRGFLQGVSLSGLAVAGGAFAGRPAATPPAPRRARVDERFDPALGNWPPYAAAIPAGRGHVSAAASLSASKKYEESHD